MAGVVQRKTSGKADWLPGIFLPAQVRFLIAAPNCDIISVSEVIEHGRSNNDN